MAAKKSSTNKPKAPKPVTAKHKIEFTAPTDPESGAIVNPDEEAEDVEVEEVEAGEGLMGFEEVEGVEVKRPMSFKQQLRQKLAKRGIGGQESLNLRIDRMPMFEKNGFAGVKAEKDFCGIIQCTDEFFDTDEYLTSIQQAYGPGNYWLTVRHKNSIVAQWREGIGGFALPGAVNENGQPSPTIIYNQPPQTTPMQPRDPWQELRGAFKMVREFKEELGLTPAAPAAPPAPALDPDTLLLQSLAANDKFMDKIQNGAIRKILGDKAVDEDPSIGAVAMEMVKTGQAEKAITAVGNFALRLADRIFSAWGLGNGQAPASQTQVQNQDQAPGGQNQNVPLPGIQGGPQVQRAAIPGAGSAGGPMDGEYTSAESATSEAAPTLMQIIARLPINHAFQMVVQGQASAEDIALSKLIDGCGRGANPQAVLDWVYHFADALNDQLPDYSIDLYIEEFGKMNADQIIKFIGALPGADQVVALPHARKWVEDLQAAFEKSQVEDGEEKE